MIFVVFLKIKMCVHVEMEKALYLGRPWVCAGQGDVDDVGDGEEACRP